MVRHWRASARGRRGPRPTASVTQCDQRGNAVGLAPGCLSVAAALRLGAGHAECSPASGSDRWRPRAQARVSSQPRRQRCRCIPLSRSTCQPRPRASSCRSPSAKANCNVLGIPQKAQNALVDAYDADVTAGMRPAGNLPPMPHWPSHEARMPAVPVLDRRGRIVTALALAAELGLGRELASVLPREVRDCAGCPQAAAKPRQAHPTLTYERCLTAWSKPEDAVAWSRETDTRGRSTLVTGPPGHRASIEQRGD